MRGRSVLTRARVSARISSRYGWRNLRRAMRRSFRPHRDAWRANPTTFRAPVRARERSLLEDVGERKVAVPLADAPRKARKRTRAEFIFDRVEAERAKQPGRIERGATTGQAHGRSLTMKPGSNMRRPPAEKIGSRHGPSNQSHIMIASTSSSCWWFAMTSVAPRLRGRRPHFRMRYAAVVGRPSPPGSPRSVTRRSRAPRAPSLLEARGRPAAHREHDRPTRRENTRPH